MKNIYLILFTLFNISLFSQVVSKNDNFLDSFEITYLNNEHLIYQKTQAGNFKKWYNIKYVYTDKIKFKFQDPVLSNINTVYRALYLLTEKESTLNIGLEGSGSLPNCPKMYFLAIGNKDAFSTSTFMIPLERITQYILE